MAIHWIRVDDDGPGPHTFAAKISGGFLVYTESQNGSSLAFVASPAGGEELTFGPKEVAPPQATSSAVTSALQAGTAPPLAEDVTMG